MSLKGLLVSKLQEAFGTYIDGLDRENLKMSVWSGAIEQKNLKLKREALDALDLPIAVSAGFLNRFYVKVPWTSLANDSVEVEISGLYLLATPNRGLHESGGAEDSAAARARRLSLLQVAAVRRLTKLTEQEALRQAMANEDDSTFAQRMGKRILANLKVTITNVHVRFEDTPPRSTSLGIGSTAVCYRTGAEEPGACITVPVAEFAQLIRQRKVPPDTKVRTTQRLLPRCPALPRRWSQTLCQ